MSPDDVSRALEELARELDLLVYRLERPPGPEAAWSAERAAVRREIEGLQRRADELAQKVR